MFRVRENKETFKKAVDEICKRLVDIRDSQDRVNISLAEYKRLTEDRQLYAELFAHMNIPREVVESIIGDSVKVSYADDAKDFTRHYCITFDVYDDPIQRKWTPEY